MWPLVMHHFWVILQPRCDCWEKGHDANGLKPHTKKEKLHRPAFVLFWPNTCLVARSPQQQHALARNKRHPVSCPSWVSQITKPEKNAASLLNVLLWMLSNTEVGVYCVAWWNTLAWGKLVNQLFKDSLGPILTYKATKIGSRHFFPFSLFFFFC